MSRITIAGSVTSALTHFTMFGLAVLCEERWPGRVRLGWTGGAEPEAFVTVADVAGHDIAEAVRDAAASASGTGGWARAEFTYSDSKTPRSPISPRIKAIDPVRNPGDWAGHQQVRWRVLDMLIDEGDHATLELLTGLGEAAYWRFDRQAPRPDEGASRWEMKTRNKGQEFIVHRLLPLAEEIAGWTADGILAGLRGEAVRDPHGQDKADSRSATGFRRPGPTDNAMAWCALWGIAMFPVSHRTGGLSTTPGAWPPAYLHPRAMLLPVLAGPVTPSRYRTVLTARALADLGEAHGPVDGGGDDAVTDRAHRWLRQRGAMGVLRFPILKTGSPSAPERQVLEGTPCRP